MFKLVNLPVGAVITIGLLLMSVMPARCQYQFTTIDAPGADATFALGVNNAGTIVGGVSSNTSQGFSLSNNSYSYTNVPDAQYTVISGINSLGTVVGDYTDSNFISHGFLQQSNGTVMYLPDFSEQVSINDPAAINSSGEVVGTYSLDPSGNTNTLQGFIFNNGSYSTYDVPGAQGTQIVDINDHNQMLVLTDNMSQSYLLNAGTLTSIKVPGADETQAFGINDNGQIVGNYSLNGVTNGFIWNKGVFTTIDFPGSDDTRLFGINDKDQIVGTYGTFAHGLLVQAVPEASTFVILLVLLLMGVVVILSKSSRQS